jgi:hypothetical protein
MYLASAYFFEFFLNPLNLFQSTINKAKRLASNFVLQASPPSHLHIQQSESLSRVRPIRNQRDKAISRYTVRLASQAASSGERYSPAVASKRIFASAGNSSSPCQTTS